MTDFDDQLRSELNRRADSVDLPREWARHELSPSVMSAIETRPQRVATSRAPAFAGLAAASAIVLILVVAMPRLALAPGQTAGSTEGGATPVPRPLNLAHTLPTSEFASLLAAGELANQTVVVEGRIVQGEFVVERSPCPAGGSDLCSIGDLEGTDPPIHIATSWLASLEGEGQSQGNPDSWSWWNLRTPPVEGNLVLRVTGPQSVEYIGRAANDIEHPGTVADVSALDVARWDPDQVFFVNGWLDWSGDRECPDSNSDVAGLPGRGCSPSSLMDPSQGPAGHIVVQDGAYPEFAPNPDLVDDSRRELRRAIYAVSSRLEGTCDAEPPCWLWNIVGRLSGDLDLLLRPSDAPPAPREILCADPNASLAYGAPTITDEAGLVLNCSSWRSSADPGDGVRVTNPEGNLKLLRLEWAGTPCDIASRFVLFQGPDGYVINGQRPEHACDKSRVPHSMTLELNRDVDATTVSASLTYSGPFPSPTPHVGDHECVGTATLFEGGAPVSSGVTITDEIGLVDSCQDTFAAADGEVPLIVENLDGDPNILRLTWSGVCSISSHFVLRPHDGTYELVVSTPPPTLICDGFPVSHDVRIFLTGHIARSDLQVTYVQQQEATPTPSATEVRWELAPSVRPTDSTEWLEFLVYEADCPEHTVPSGRVRDPQIDYGTDSVTVAFTVVELPTADCPSSPDTPIRVHLDQPLGNRKLVDGGSTGNDTRVVSHDDGLLLVEPAHAYIAATDRFGWLIGEDACPKRDDNLPLTDEAALTEMANSLTSAEGMLGNRLAWVGNEEDAVRELGGFELYRDQERQWFILALAEDQEWLGQAGKPGDLVVADLTSIPISGGRTIWVPGAWFQGFASADCDASVDTPGSVSSSDAALDFAISINVPRVDHAAGQPIDGLDARFVYSGAQTPITITGSGSGYAWLSYFQIDGGATPPWAMSGDCHPYEIESGPGYAPEFLSSNSTGGQVISLPPGVYRLSAAANFVVGEGCQGQVVDLSASIFIRVR